MNADIRLSVGFWQHPKTFRLEKRIGLKGVRSLQILWCWCAQNRPDGNLSDLDASEVEFVADWRGKKGAFVETCVACNWLDETDEGYKLHEWADYNPYQAQAGSREEARKEKARHAANTRWGKKRQKEANECSSNATSNAQAHANAMQDECSSNATSNAQKMPSPTTTSTSIKGNIKNPPIVPPGGTEGDEKLLSEVGIEFQELREVYNAEMRVEGPLAGFAEYKALKKARDSTGMSLWPGIDRILSDIEKRKSAGVWNPGYEIGLGRYLAERTWLAPIMPKSRASPMQTGQPATPTEFQKHLQDKRMMGEFILAQMQEEKNAKGAIDIAGSGCPGLPDEPYATGTGGSV